MELEVLKSQTIATPTIGTSYEDIILKNSNELVPIDFLTILSEKDFLLKTETDETTIK